MKRDPASRRPGLPRRLPAFAIAAFAIAAPALVLSSRGSPAPDLFELHPALEWSVFAEAPMVVDPVALAFDELGRAYVVEMGDYPYGFGPDRSPGGTVRLLEDLDGDGRADRATLFAGNLSFPTSITPWNGGVLIAAPPDILFLQDTTGDGRADVRRTILTGFRLGVTDSNVNGLRWGPDNWIHGANGGNGGDLSSPLRPGDPLRLGHRDFRFRPGTGEFEPTSHSGGGFGLVFDDWGRSFTTYNIDHIQQRIALAADVSRHPGLPPVETTHSISDHGEMARIYPISPAQTRPNHPEQAGHFSAAGGMGFISHRDWPAALRDSVLVCDVVGNLVHRDLLVPNGPILTATRAPEEQSCEFLASRDPMFRPVGLESGPDGALYLLDMRREVIEHPDYIPRKLLETQDIRAGDGEGRIYRIAPRGWTATRDLPGRLAPADWVSLLDSPNPWTRLTAQRLLVSRGNPDVVPALRQLARSTREPVTRIQTLRTLEGLGSLDDDTLALALEDPSAPLRAQAIVLARPRVPTSPRFGEAVDRLLADPHPEVRFQAAWAAGDRDWVRALRSPGFAELMKQDHAHPWSRRAALSTLGPFVHRVLGSILYDRQFWQDITPPKLDLVRETAEVMGGTNFVPPPSPTPADRRFGRLWAEDVGDGGRSNEPTEVSLPALRQLPEPVRLAFLEGFSAGWARRDPSAPSLSRSSREQLTTLLNAWTEPPAILGAAWRLARQVGIEIGESPRRQLALHLDRLFQPDTGFDTRRDIVRLLAVGEFDQVGPVLFRLLDGREPSALQQAALAVLRDHREPAVGEGLVRHWPSLAPAVRPAVVNLLVYRGPFNAALLDGIENGTLPLGELNLDLEHRRRLLRHAAPDIRSRAAAFVSDEEYANRSALVEEWLARLPETGDPARGRAAFDRLCAQCHHANGLGHAVGPDLSHQGHRSIEDLVSNTLDPNMAMNPAFVAYTAETTDGDEETGILHAESATTITLLQALGRTVEIPRARLRSLRSLGRSLMPEGLEAGLSPQELRDLIAFLQQPPGQASPAAATAPTNPSH
ncbi:MAG: c-type cytochrome [Verrucomicrobiae bacterium]|nr:c-type cytochrome [Verrucomicrobiae bacterium]